MIRFIIPGEPKGKGRHRTTRTGITYTPETTVNYENWVKICFQDAKQEKLDGQLGVRIGCYFDIPKSYSQKKKMACIIGNLRPTKKPDCDNIAKIILDALNGLAYDDDKCIVDCMISKSYSESPRVEVDIFEV